MHVKDTQCKLPQARTDSDKHILKALQAKKKKSVKQGPGVKLLLGFSEAWSLEAWALHGATSAAIFSTGPSRSAALLRDEPGYKYVKFSFKDQRRDRRGRSSCCFERSLLRQTLSFVQWPCIVAQLPTASGNTVLQPN